MEWMHPYLFYETGLMGLKHKQHSFLQMYGPRKRKTYLQKHGLMLCIVRAEDFFSQVFHRHIQTAVSCYLLQTDVKALLKPWKVGRLYWIWWQWKSWMRESEKWQIKGSLTGDLSVASHSSPSLFDLHIAVTYPCWFPRLLLKPTGKVNTEE